MKSIINKCIFSLAIVLLCGMSVPAYAQGKDPLPIWKASTQDLAKLGKEFSDSKITLRPPKNLQQVELETSPEMAKAGISAYAWTPGGEFPSHKNLSIALAPQANQQSDALKEFVLGMKKSFQRKSESIKFGEVTRGSFLGVEAQLGTYTAQISQKEVLGFYLVGIDKVGAFAVSAMIPRSDANSEEIKLLRASMLTFKRAK